MALATIILAAGQGKRMQSDLPKVLHEVGNAPMLAHVLATARQLDSARIVVVVGHGGDQVAVVARDIDPDVLIATQQNMLGTGDAVAQALPALAGFEGDTLVLYGDTPLITPQTIARMQAARAAGAALVVLGFQNPPGGYGRLVLGDDGGLEAIVEAKDADAATYALTLCNSGVMLGDAGLMAALVGRLKPSARTGELYLTSIVALARAAGHACAVVECPADETEGVNTRADLAAIEAAFQARARRNALEDGVTLQAPDTVLFSQDTALGRDVVVEPNVVFAAGVSVESGARIRAFSHLEGCHVASGAVVGPYARLRPGADIGVDARIGNFVEIKAAEIAEGAKVNHLSYVGDAVIGPRSNIGAGTIFCNYDGVFKHQAVLGADVFIGSNSALVSPLRIGAGAMVGSGSVITRDVPAGDLALSRARQENKPGLGARLMARLRDMKAAGKRP
ncbi:bifunctional UDP-N-acetylglucosamine diphosphorylase/glucosamine-1-phosphate N-acetyltransferase GlmU [Abyssibius alkaniclasticus]|uniref:bifunctional UDP-N-acetylglucosamine diphosphorylase/glucosamine-1-phosphate N-acetyltransferase GlmU n=1 Tax=Abyssibius alkaniclasticus TaxID=2881234 RepID=UPI004058797F